MNAANLHPSSVSTFIGSGNFKGVGVALLFIVLLIFALVYDRKQEPELFDTYGAARADILNSS